ncbi:CAP domain-containing protein [Nonomuraea sp. NPDC049152]|uniref:CAP domain-containing protein n=1 Tax=Nonomuraea sp. NPDC049152 TaxID=3154350 RepID=UPI0033D075DE
MRRQLQALACLGSLAALSTPVTAAHAETQPNSCRVVAAKPYLDTNGVVRGGAARTGCDDQARLRVRIVEVRPGPDRLVKSGSQLVTNGRVVAGVRCSDVPRRLYVTATDYRGNAHRSGVAALSCDSTPTPTPTPTPTATPTPSPTTTSTATPTATPTSTPTGGGSTVEDEVVKLTNAERASGGCKPLTHDPQLRAAAEGHSADMAAKGYFDHTSPDGRNPGDRIKASGFSPVSAWGENIAKGQRTAADVVRGWMNSPGHRANIMNCNYTHIGVGHDSKGPHWTQVFARH